MCDDLQNEVDKLKHEKKVLLLEKDQRMMEINILNRQLTGKQVMIEQANSRYDLFYKMVREYDAKGKWYRLCNTVLTGENDGNR